MRHKLMIVNGPSKWDLMLSLFDPEGNSEELRTTSFTVSHNTYNGFLSSFRKEIETRVIGVELVMLPHEEAFHIKVVNIHENEYAEEMECFEGIYSAKSRKGELEHFDPQ